jgi:hypothetical protein
LLSAGKSPNGKIPDAQKFLGGGKIFFGFPETTLFLQDFEQ